MHYYLLMLVTSLLHTSTSTVYYVMSDDHYHPINDNTYTLQHYLNNTNKYFTSNTQLHFLPGQYYLNNDLIIQGVSNFSLIGNRINEVINTVINCTSPAGVVVVGSSNILIANIVMNECGNDYYSKNQTKDLKTVLVVDSQSITVTYFHSLWNQKLCGLKLVNALESKLLNVVSSYLLIWYIGNGNTSIVSTTDTFLIDNFQAYSEIDDIYTIKIKWHKINFNFNATILNVKFKNKLALWIVCFQCLGNNTITISNYDFNDKVPVDSIMNNKYPLYYNDDIYECFYHICDAKIAILLYSTRLENHASENTLYFTDCNFINNSRSRKLLLINIKNSYNTKLPLITLNNCMFYNNRNAQLLLVRCKNNDSKNSCAYVFVENTTASSNIHDNDDMIYIYDVVLTSENVKIINNSFLGNIFFVKNYIIINAINSYLKYKSYNEFSKNTARVTIMGSAIHMCENSILNFSSNTLHYNVEIYTLPNEDKIDTCAVQYISERGNLDKEFQMGQALNYSIIHNNNNNKFGIFNDMYHCEWDSTSAFWTSSPLYVNQRFIHQNFSMIKLEKNICLCKKNKTMDCYVEELGSFYPGVTVSFNFIVFSVKTEFSLLEQIDDSYFACKGKNSVVLEQRECRYLNITLIHESGMWCELFLVVSPKYPSLRITVQSAIYTIILLPCPRGFSLHTGKCECDTTLSCYIPSLTHCNIDNQTIPRPANSWISAHTVNNSHSYHVSLHCPFDYCLPHSSHLNFSTPDYQCQFNRSGIIIVWTMSTRSQCCLWFISV